MGIISNMLQLLKVFKFRIYNYSLLKYNLYSLNMHKNKIWKIKKLKLEHNLKTHTIRFCSNKSNSLLKIFRSFINKLM